MGKTQASPEQPIPASDDELEGGGSTNYPWYTPKFWYGMGSGTWIRLMVENGAVISPSRFHILITASMLSLLNTLGRIISDQLYSSRLRNSKLPNNPIFIIGHWRSVTTVLHELLMLDHRFITPNTYQCFALHFFWLPHTANGLTFR